MWPYMCSIAYKVYFEIYLSQLAEEEGAINFTQLDSSNAISWEQDLNRQILIRIYGQISFAVAATS